MDKRGAFFVPVLAGFVPIGCAARGGADGDDPAPTISDAQTETETVADARGPRTDAETDAPRIEADAEAGADAEIDAATTSNPRCAGAPIVATPGTWSWLPVPEAKCGKGAGLGISVNPSSTSDELIVFLNGGGSRYGPSCAGGMSTPVANMDGDYSITKLENDMSAFPSGGAIFDRGSAANPFRDGSHVFVSYCTGDPSWSSARLSCRHEHGRAGARATKRAGTQTSAADLRIH